jgi:hypothetical protein
MKQWANAADAVALLPFFIELLTEVDLLFLVTLRLVRVFSFARRFRPVDAALSALASAAPTLTAPLTFFAAALVASSAVVYYAERGTYDAASQRFLVRDCKCEATPAFVLGSRACPRIESRFLSIPFTLWWGASTLTTVGDGDLVPQCPTGRVAASLAMLAAVALLSVVTAVVCHHFTVAVELHDAAERSQLRWASGRGDAAAPNDVAATVDVVAAAQSPAIRLLTFLARRLEQPTVSVAAPTPYLVMLIDWYLGTLRHTAASAPAAVVLELEGVSLAAGVGSIASKRVTLNRHVELIFGVAPQPNGLTATMAQPDVVLPAIDDRGVPYRISERHCAVVVPPQYSDEPAVLRPLPGGAVAVNGVAVGAAGVRLSLGDVINLHDAERPLLFKLAAVHPFALDV